MFVIHYLNLIIRYPILITSHTILGTNTKSWHRGSSFVIDAADYYINHVGSSLSKVDNSLPNFVVIFTIM